MADEKYCKNCGAPLSKEAEPIPSEPKGYFPLLRQKGIPTPQDEKTDRDFIIMIDDYGSFRHNCESLFVSNHLRF